MDDYPPRGGGFYFIRLLIIKGLMFLPLSFGLVILILIFILFAKGIRILVTLI